MNSDMHLKTIKAIRDSSTMEQPEVQSNSRIIHVMNPMIIDDNYFIQLRGVTDSLQAMANKLDSEDPLAILRNDFILPQRVYLCGNSLGPQPKRAVTLLLEEMEVWAKDGVEGHFQHQYKRPWMTVDEPCLPPLSRVVGALENEIAVMGSLTSNLHFLLAAFYRPTKNRFKILLESKAFPSDHYAIESHIRHHGFDPSEGMLIANCKPGNECLEDDDIIELMQKNKDSIALILLGGVHYFTGKVLDMELLTKEAHNLGLCIGFDLAHAAGNVWLSLHDWNVDFAAWCSYKYLNSGPGGIAGIFVHSIHHKSEFPGRLQGWWGHEKATRFLMDNRFRAIEGAGAFQLSNPCVLACTTLLASLEVFDKTSMQDLCTKSVLLTSFLRFILGQLCPDVKIITPKATKPNCHGAQLSLKFPKANVNEIFSALNKEGIVTDKREPDVLRVTPAPLYTKYNDCFIFAITLSEMLKTL